MAATDQQHTARQSDRDRVMAVVRDMRRLLRRLAFDARCAGDGELLDDAEAAMVDLTRALGPLADLVHDMGGRRPSRWRGR